MEKMRKFLSLLSVFMLITLNSIRAENFSFVVNDVQIVPGGESEIVVSLVNSPEWTSKDGVIGFGMQIRLPEGVSWQGTISGNYYLNAFQGEEENTVCVAFEQTTSMVGYSIFDEGELFRIPVSISDGVTSSLQGSIGDITAEIVYDNGGIFDPGKIQIHLN